MWKGHVYNVPFFSEEYNTTCKYRMCDKNIHEIYFVSLKPLMNYPKKKDSIKTQ